MRSECDFISFFINLNKLTNEQLIIKQTNISKKNQKPLQSNKIGTTNYLTTNRPTNKQTIKPTKKPNQTKDWPKLS